MIGFGSADAGTSRAHSDARGAEQQAVTKRTLGFDPEKFFVVPEEALARYREAVERGAAEEAEWSASVDASPNAAELRAIWSGELEFDTGSFAPDDGPMATRAASGKVLARIAPEIPQLIGGSADLTPSNNTRPPDWDELAPGTHEGRYVHFGVREHGMGAVVNGLVLSGLRAYGGTFFNFLDYMKPAVRLSALMNIPSIWVYTHDSVGLGEDGPTHQPIEQLATLRAQPNTTVFRPADANETAAGWRIALERRNPTALALTRQALPVLDPATYPTHEASRGGYVLDGDDDPQVLLIATGSEVHVALGAREILTSKGIRSRVVSLPSWELFEEQALGYREQVIPPSVRARVCVEAASPIGWERYAGEGEIVALDRFGASAPGATVLEHLGFTPQRVADAASDALSRITQGASQ